MYNTSPDGLIEIKLSEQGISSEKPKTVIDLFEEAVKLQGPELAFVSCDNEQWSWNMYYEDVISCAKGFIKLGLKEFDCINIIGFNSPEWFIADMGCIYAGGLVAGVYSTNKAVACAYVAKHSKAKIIVAEDEIQLNKYIKYEEQSDLESVICYIV